MRQSMDFPARTYKIKTGASVVIRVPKIEEAQSLIDLKLGYIKNATTIPMTVDEYPHELEKEERLIDRYAKSANSILLVAEQEGRLIGNIDLTGSERGKMRHTGMIGMGIQERWRNQGLGSCLIQSVLDWAKDSSELEIVWLDVYDSNTLGCHLYQKMGFQVSGVIPGFFKEESGYKDKIQMYKRIR
ncbi:MAG: GNAT family N-acetyltransferase [Bacteroidota bacterium]